MDQNRLIPEKPLDVLRWEILPNKTIKLFLDDKIVVESLAQIDDHLVLVSRFYMMKWTNVDGLLTTQMKKDIEDYIKFASQNPCHFIHHALAFLLSRLHQSMNEIKTNSWQSKHKAIKIIESFKNQLEYIHLIYVTVNPTTHRTYLSKEGLL